MIVQFNSKLHSLVVDQADVFAATHSIPVVYARPSYVRDGYLSYRLIARNEIEEYLRRNADDVQVLSVDLDDRIQSNAKNCVFLNAPGKIISVSVYDDTGEGWKDWNIGFETTSRVSRDRSWGIQIGLRPSAADYSVFYDRM